MFIFYLQKNFYYLSGRFQTLGNNFRTEENILEIIIFLRKSRIFWFYLSFLRCTWVFLSFFKFWFLKSQANKLFCRVKPTKFFAWSSQANEFFCLVKPSQRNFFVWSSQAKQIILTCRGLLEIMMDLYPWILGINFMVPIYKSNGKNNSQYDFKI